MPVETLASNKAARANSDSTAASVVLELYERESEYLYRLALRITGSHEDARDALQESFAKLLEKCDALHAVLRPEAWIRTILTRTAIDIRRKRHRKDETMLESTVEAYSADSSDGEIDGSALEYSETVQMLRTALEQLPALDRAIVLRRAVEKIPLADLAESLGLSEKAVRNRLCRARAFLKRCVKKAE
jgi:RNA polymerase sigma-70 factor (ECF subfamily)